MRRRSATKKRPSAWRRRRPTGRRPPPRKNWPPTEDEAVARLLLQAGSPARSHLEKATSAPRPLEAGTASSAAPDAEATSAAPIGWVRGGGTGPLNQALLDVQAKLRAEGNALQKCTKAHLEARTAVRVSFFSFLILVFLCGGAPAHPLGVVPEFRDGC